MNSLSECSVYISYTVHDRGCIRCLLDSEHRSILRPKVLKEPIKFQDLRAERGWKFRIISG